jgi:hypothetical protein
MGERRISVIILADATSAAATIKALGADVKGLGSSAQAGSGTATTALAGYDKAARGAAAGISTSMEATRRFSVGAAQAGAEIRQVANALNVHIEATRRFSAGAAQAGTEVRQQASAWAAQTAAAGQAGEKTSKLSEFFSSLKTAMGQTTNQISSQGTAWAGYDRVATSVFGALAGPLGGLSVGMGLLITIGGSLISKLFGLAGGGRELAEITKAMVEKNLALADSYGRLVKNGSDVDGSLQRQSESYKKILAADVSALLTVYVEQYKRLKTAQDEQTKSDERAKQAKVAYNAALEQNSKIAQGTLPITGELGAVVNYYATATENATAKQGKQNQEVAGTVEALKAMYQAGVITTEGLYAMARGAGADELAIARLRAELENTKTAQELFYEALKKQSAGFSTQSTWSGLIQQIIDVGNNLDAVMRIPGETFHTAVLSQKSDLEQIKQTIQGMTLTQAGYNAFVADLPKLMRDALAEVVSIDKGMKNFADHTKDAAAAPVLLILS